MAKRKSFDWDKAFSSVRANSERVNAQISKQRSANPCDCRNCNQKTKPNNQQTLDLSELQKRLRF